MFDLRGRVIIITGAGGGIGRATALALAGQGANLMLTDIDLAKADETAKLAGDLGVETRTARHDVSSSADWQQTLDDVQKAWGRLDALVNNAGFMVTTPFLETTVDQLQKSLTINSVSVFIGSQMAVPLMTQTAETHGTKPSIVNLSSLYGQIAGPAHTAYSASKGAVRAMTKGIAVELASRGIRVNTVHPGPVRTPLLAGAIDSLSGAGKMPGGDKGHAAVARSHPMGRTAEAEDVAGVITFLCSDASSFMTGAELTVDGGYGLL